MSKVNVYNLEDYLPLYHVKKDSSFLLRNGREVIIGTYHSYLADDIENTEKENIYLNNIDEEEECPKWVNKQVSIGILGEQIIYAYLKRQYKLVEHVSTRSSSLGYDIRVTDGEQEIAYEVKTTTKNCNKFHITYNELAVANKMKENYNIFYLYINKSIKRIAGYIINNPINLLGLDFKKITEIKDYENVNVASSTFIIQFKQNFIEDLDVIQLENYVNLI